MSLCFCSLTRSFPQFHELNFQWTPSPNRSIFPFNLTTRINSSSRYISRLEVASPDTGAQSPVIDTKEEEKEEVSKVLNGVEGTQSDDKTVNSSYRVKKKRDDENGFENRFKLRNGKEVVLFFVSFSFCFENLHNYT